MQALLPSDSIKPRPPIPRPQAVIHPGRASAAMPWGRECGPARDRQPRQARPDRALAKAADAAAGA
jgi:hypothetical protein